ncbi:hypothetical protein ACMA1I_22965 [Pontibacter sp. 13R65]|uniref:hypothetical protein n=1 Tax=Pontibacter sp. 13R65 TaxID=3127458 RepID=UPI00301BECBE
MIKEIYGKFDTVNTVYVLIPIDQPTTVGYFSIKMFTMKNLYSLLILSIFISSCSTTNPSLHSVTELADPSINRDNYYEYHKKSGGGEPLTTAWLRRSEAVQVIIDELKELGHLPKEYVLYEFADGNTLVVDAYISEKDLAIVFNQSHYADVKKEHRDISRLHQFKYKYAGAKGTPYTYTSFTKNFIVLQETWYWYQYLNDKPSKGMVSRATIEQILRQDVRALVADYQSSIN